MASGAGDPKAAAKLRGDPEPGEHRRDLGPASVDDDGMDATPLHKDDVLCECPLEIIVDHGVSAVLDHDDLACIGLQPGQRFGEDRRLLHQRQWPGFRLLRLRLGVHVAYSAFSLT